MVVTKSKMLCTAAGAGVLALASGAYYFSRPADAQADAEKKKSGYSSKRRLFPPRQYTVTACSR